MPLLSVNVNTILEVPNSEDTNFNDRFPGVNGVALARILLPFITWPTPFIVYESIYVIFGLACIWLKLRIILSGVFL